MRGEHSLPAASAPAVGALGKLPWAGDFVRAGGGPDVEVLFRWLEDGMGAAASRGERWKQVFDGAAQKAFVFPAPDGRGLVGGVLAASRDEVGRRFPFVLFSEFDRAPLGQAPYVLPLALGDFLQTAGGLIERMQAERLDLYRELGGVASVDFSLLAGQFDGYVGWAQSASLRAAGQAIFGPGWKEGLAFATYVTIESIRPFHGQENPPTPLAVRFPVGMGFAGAASFWLHVVRLCAGWKTTVPHCFWSFDEVGASVTICFGSISSSTFVDLWEPHPQNESLSDLVSGAIPSGDFLGTVRPDLTRLIDDDDATVQQFLIQLVQPAR